MENSRVLADQTVIVENGIIRALAPSAALETAGMSVVDGSGRYLMPGLADMHTHITDRGVCTLYVVNGITRLRNMDGRPWHLALAKKFEHGAELGPRLFTASPLIDGLGEHGQTARPYSLVLTDPAQADTLVRRLVLRGYQEIKAYQWLGLDELSALGAAAARAGVRMAGHCPDGVTYEQSIAAGMGCFEHLTGIATGHLRGGLRFPSNRDATARRGTRESLELVAHHLDFDAIRRLAGELAKKDIWNCPTLVVWQKQIQQPSVALADPNLKYEHRSVVRELAELIRARFAALPCTAAEWVDLGRARDEALARVVSILHEEGAPLLLGTDAPNPFVLHGASLHDELANLVRAGLSPYEALRCGTIHAARFLGESATSGSIAVGKRADLLLLGANPLKDVAAVRSSLEAVFLNGRCLGRRDLDALTEEYLAGLEAPPSEDLPEFGKAEGSQIVRQGSFAESVSATSIGRASYRHIRLPQGGWLVEERSARSGPRGPQRRAADLWLGQDWTLRSAQIDSDTDIGRERWDIRWSEGAYRVRITEPDGAVAESTLVTAPLLPGERIASSVLPAWSASQAASRSVVSLSIEHEVAQTAAILAEPVPSTEGQAQRTRCTEWQLRITHPGEAVTQKFRVSHEGALLSLRDTLYGAPRELSAETA
jgi:hypothetical protein